MRQGQLPLAGGDRWLLSRIDQWRYPPDVTFTLNFSPESWQDPGPTVTELIGSRHWTAPLVSVLINGSPVPAERFGERRIREGDRVEAFFLVSGG
ncbi:MAG TPA: sulfur carrier protein ThiS [Rectinemataceae bacterium]|nr:sulfur carrier protein ThiS [Rectinemataceae bacterium]